MQRPLSLLLACMACCFLCSCSPSKDPSYYLLQSSGTPLVASSLPRTTLAVFSVNVPDYLEGKEIVIRDDGGNVLTFARKNIWGEDLPKGVQRVLREELAQPLLGQGITVLASQDARLASAYSLIVDIVRLDAQTNGKVSLEARWTLIDDKESCVKGRGSFAEEENIPSPVNSSKECFSSIAKAQSRLLQSLGREIARNVRGIIPLRRKGI